MSRKVDPPNSSGNPTHQKGGWETPPISSFLTGGRPSNPSTDDHQIAPHEGLLGDEMLRVVTGKTGITVIVLIGQTGEGKSTLGNILLGHQPNDGPFATSASIDSQTHNITVTDGSFLGIKERKIRIVDTPGHGDSYGQDRELRKIMVQGLKKIEFAHVFLWVRNAARPRIDMPEKEYLGLLQEVFGPGFAKNLMIAFTHWSHGARDEERRKQSGITTEKLKEGFQRLLQNEGNDPETFQLSMTTLDAFYCRSDAQEANAFNREAEIMWNAIKKFQKFPTIDIEMAEGIVFNLQRDVTTLKQSLEDAKKNTISLHEKIVHQGKKSAAERQLLAEEFARQRKEYENQRRKLYEELRIQGEKFSAEFEDREKQIAVLIKQLEAEKQAKQQEIKKEQEKQKQENLRKETDNGLQKRHYERELQENQQAIQRLKERLQSQKDPNGCSIL